MYTMFYFVKYKLTTVILLVSLLVNFWPFKIKQEKKTYEVIKKIIKINISKCYIVK